MNLKQFRFGPVSVAQTAAANILSPPALSGGVNAPASGTLSCFIVLKNIRIINTGGSALLYGFAIGATGAFTAATAVLGFASSIAAKQFISFQGPLRISAGEFFTGVFTGGLAGDLTVEGDGEIGVQQDVGS